MSLFTTPTSILDADINLRELFQNQSLRTDIFSVQCHISLVKLDLRNNLLTMITPGLSRLNNLVELNLSGNRINHLSKVSGLSMPNLKLLHVFSCQVKTVDGAQGSLIYDETIKKLIVRFKKLYRPPNKESFLNHFQIYYN